MNTAPPSPAPAAPAFTVDARHHLHAGPGQLTVADTPTPNRGGLLDGPRLIVIHYTAGADAAGAVRYLCQPSTKASAHLVVARGGQVYQLAACNRITWHAGESHWGPLKGLNRYAVGIEIANRGFVPDHQARPEADYVHLTHRAEHHPRWWERYNPHQVETVAQLCAALCRRYHLTPAAIVGHDDIAPGRKADPGPAWDWPAFRARVAQLIEVTHHG